MSWSYSPLLPAVPSAGGPTYTLTADAGAFALSGQAAGLPRGLRLDAAQGAFALSGQPAGLLRALRLTAANGGIALSGQVAVITPSAPPPEPSPGTPDTIFDAGEIAVLGPSPSFRISGVPRRAPTTPLAVQRAVLHALKIALAGRDVPVFDHVPHGQRFPFVEMGAMQVLTIDAVEAEGYDIIFYLSVWSDYRGQAEVLEILQRIYDALHGQTLMLEHGAPVLSRLTDQRTDRDADGVTYQGTATARIMAMV